jgi:hypothetical protein
VLPIGLQNPPSGLPWLLPPCAGFVTFAVYKCCKNDFHHVGASIFGQLHDFIAIISLVFELIALVL